MAKRPEDCLKCGRCYSWQDDDYYLCAHEDAPRDNRITDPYDIPFWCPLEDD